MWLKYRAFSIKMECKFAVCVSCVLALTLELMTHFAVSVPCLFQADFPEHFS